VNTSVRAFARRTQSSRNRFFTQSLLFFLNRMSRSTFGLLPSHGLLLGGDNEKRGHSPRGIALRLSCSLKVQGVTLDFVDGKKASGTVEARAEAGRRRYYRSPGGTYGPPPGHHQQPTNPLALPRPMKTEKWRLISSLMGKANYGKEQKPRDTSYSACSLPLL
jgi:hypothetical protein